MDFGTCASDASLGPTVRGCRGDFDFTIKFERIFLSLIPASIFVALSLPRVLYLVRKQAVVGGSLFRLIKVGVIAVFAVINLSLVVLSAAKQGRLRAWLVASSTMTFVSSLSMIALSFLEHSRSPRPSILLNAYLFLTLLFDIAQSRTLWLASTTEYELAFTRLSTTTVALKAAMMLLESQHKTRWVQWDAKSHSPEETTGIYGLGAFVWLNKLFLTGYRKTLRMDDLFPLDSAMAADSLQARLASIMQNSKYYGQRFGLAKAMVKTLSVPLMLPIAPRIAVIGFSFCQPFLINSVLDLLQEPSDKRDPNKGYGLIGATVLIYLGSSLSTAFYWYFQERVLYMARGCLAGAIYKKTTEAKISVADDSAAITLMSTDIEAIRRGFMFIHEFWANLVEVALASWLLERQLGVAFVAPIGVVLLCAGLTAFTSRYASKRQKAWMDRIQKRVGMTAGVITNMKNLRISGITEPIEDLIQGLRIDELKTGNRFRMIMVLSVTIAFTPVLIAPLITFAVTSTFLDVTVIFTSFSYLLLLANPFTALFQTIPTAIGAFACLSRVQAFLEKDPRIDFREARIDKVPEEKRGSTDGSSPGTPALTVSKGFFGWQEDKNNLQDIDVDIPTSRLTIVVGPIASGKSTLCKTLLGETPIFHGHVILGPNSRRIGYCDQNPFLTNSTIKENIVGFSEYNESRYNEVIEATMLPVDLLTLPNGDDTKVGSNGITLSGGQKQRVSIARALYLETDLFIFDDILSGLDADTEEQVFRRVFGPEGLIRMRNATAVLCTHSVRHLPSADHIIALGTDGRIVEQGTFQDLVANQKYVHSLGVKARDSDSSLSDLESSEKLDEEEIAPDPLLRPRTTDTNVSSHVSDLARANGDTTIYKHYFKSIGLFNLGAFLTTAAITGFFYNWMTVWLSFWSAGVTSPTPTHSNSWYLGLYGLFQTTCLIFLFIFCYIAMRTIIMKSGAILHQAALKTVINAPLRFFTTTDAGVVTNMFSQDMTLIDGELPSSLLNVTVDTFISLGMAAVIAVSSPYLAITYPFLVLVLWVIQKFYLRTSRQLRLLDLEAKSPLYTHYLDTIKGVATFRAFGWVEKGIILNNEFLDKSQRPAYLLAMIQRWLALTLDFTIGILAVVVVTLSTQLKSDTGFTGASLITLMSFNSSVANIIRMYTLLETSLGAVNRLKTFSDRVAPEHLPGENIAPSKSWPKKGLIEIKGVSASYGDTSDDSGRDSFSSNSSKNLALRDLDMTIRPGEKVAICGRSGSGKSSTILLLLRLLDPTPSSAENIFIDEVPLYRINRSVLRQRIIAVPQEAVFLPDGSSFKANLDPYEVATETECQRVLEAVDLWSFVSERGGISAGMSADTLSQGQKQLFSLARAILRHRVRAMDSAIELGEKCQGGILLLDEVSSSVDMDTDRAMQAIIKKEFEGYTIIMVSHRLEMVMDFDTVIVMSKGSVIERGQPRVLAETEGSKFRELYLVSRTGRDV